MLLTGFLYFTSIIVASVGTDSTQAVQLNCILLSKKSKSSAELRQR